LVRPLGDQIGPVSTPRRPRDERRRATAHRVQRSNPLYPPVGIIHSSDYPYRLLESQRRLGMSRNRSVIAHRLAQQREIVRVKDPIPIGVLDKRITGSRYVVSPIPGIIKIVARRISRHRRREGVKPQKRRVIRVTIPAGGPCEYNQE